MEIQEVEGFAQCHLPSYWQSSDLLTPPTCHERTPGFKSCLHCLVCVLAVSNPAGWREMLLLCLPPRLAVRVIDAEIFCQELCKYRVMLHLFA